MGEEREREKCDGDWKRDRAREKEIDSQCARKEERYIIL